MADAALDIAELTSEVDRYTRRRDKNHFTEDIDPILVKVRAIYSVFCLASCIAEALAVLLWAIALTPRPVCQ